MTALTVRVVHLVRRFLVSLRGRSPGADDDAWARAFLSPSEAELWDRMGPSDRAHAIEVARSVEASVGAADRRPITAALMHDVGKIVAGAGVPMRVIATLAAPLASTRWAAQHADRVDSGPLTRLAQQLRYTTLGGAMLRAAGSDPLVASWAEEHHRPSGDWTIDPDLGRALRAADDAAG